MGTYRIAEVCQNGHVSTSSADLYPDLREKFCSKCGENTMMQCPSCRKPIRGYYDSDFVTVICDYHPPAYCHQCGTPFPWTSRKITNAVALVEYSDVQLTPDEIQQFRSDVTDLTKDSPNNPISSLRIKKVLAKVGPLIASGVKDILTSVMTEAAKKLLLGG
ncbi:MAG: DUF2321 domain-containing protein [Magnetococcales bacterium]|nr:DUF2321 domain-containing protein [Magnetococcales bacterium]